MENQIPTRVKSDDELTESLVINQVSSKPENSPFQARSVYTFRILLTYVFFFEAAAYMGLPYLSLHLRESFGLTEVMIGFILMISMWLRPLWAIGAGVIGNRVSSAHLLRFGSLMSGVALVSLALSSSAPVAFAALIIANFGLSLWNPAINALVIEQFGDSIEAKKRISQLNIAMYSGAAIGAGIASILSARHRAEIFSFAGLIFLLGALLLSLHSLPVVRKCLPSQGNVPNRGIRRVQTFRKWINRESLLLSFASVAYWASYSQFNGYFSLFATDWLKQPAAVGLSFAFLTVAVAGVSFLITKSKRLQTNDLKSAGVILFALGALWSAMSLAPSLWATVLFIVSLAISEAILVMAMAHRWARLSQDHTQLMQSLNFAFCNIGMGVGSLFGGFYYRSPAQGNLRSFAVENLALCLTAGLLLLLLSHISRQREVCQ